MKKSIDQNTENVWFIKNAVRGVNLRELPRCQVIAKTTSKKCKNPAMRNSTLCCVHAGLYSPSAPYGNKNACKQNKEEKVSGFVRDCNAFLDSLFNCPG